MPNIQKNGPGEKQGISCEDCCFQKSVVYVNGKIILLECVMTWP